MSRKGVCCVAEMRSKTQLNSKSDDTNLLPSWVSYKLSQRGGHVNCPQQNCHRCDEFCRSFTNVK